MLTDHTGLPSWRASYEAFGRAHISSDPDGSVVTPNPGIPFNIRFTGQYYDAESGLHYNRFRYYSPDIGRYLSVDPVGQLGGLNVYLYVGNRPIALADHLGLACTNTVDCALARGGQNAQALAEAGVGTGVALSSIIRDSDADFDDGDGGGGNRPPCEKAAQECLDDLSPGATLEGFMSNDPGCMDKMNDKGFKCLESLAACLGGLPTIFPNGKYVIPK